MTQEEGPIRLYGKRRHPHTFTYLGGTEYHPYEYLMKCLIRLFLMFYAWL